MKALRVFLSVIVSIVLVILLVATTLLTSLKTIVRKDMVTEVIKTQVLEENTDISKDQINKILDDKETNKIINEIIDDLMEDIGSDKITINESTIDDALKYVESHKDEIEKLTGEKIDMSDINVDEIKTDINNTLAEASSSMDSNVKSVFEAYNVLTSKELFYGMIGTIVFQIILLVLLSWSAYKWLLPSGISLIVAGVIGLGSFLLSFAVVSMIAAETNMTINTSAILINSLIELAVGIIAVVVYAIVNKKKKKNKALEA